jgi:hypothetical protein
MNSPAGFLVPFGRLFSGAHPGRGLLVVQAGRLDITMEELERFTLYQGEHGGRQVHLQTA